MNTLTICSNAYLRINTRAFYSVRYLRLGEPGHPEYLNVLKNTFNNKGRAELDSAVDDLRKVLRADLPLVLAAIGRNPITVCIVPRAKACLTPDQLLFKKTVREETIRIDAFLDGTDYLCRHTNTRTTHLVAAEAKMSNYNNDGKMPHPGITRETCHLVAPEIRGKDILLVDDIYTPCVNIDEDAIQALLDVGARSVAFYAVAKAGRTWV